MRKSATTPGAQNRMRPDIDPYIERKAISRGVLRQGPAGDTVSHALEYYMADAALSLLADSLDRGTRVCSRPLVGPQTLLQPGKRDFASAPSRRNFLRFLPFDPKAGENFTAAPGLQ